MLSGEEAEGEGAHDVISLDENQIDRLLTHVRKRGEQQVGVVATELGVSEDQLKAFWRVNRGRWPEALAEAEASERQRIASGPWMPHEDTLILSHLYAKGDDPGWKEISRLLGRKVCEIRQHYREELMPVSHIWTSQDNIALINAQGELGSKWEQIAERMKLTRMEVQLRYVFLRSDAGKALMARESRATDDSSYEELEDDTVAQPPPSPTDVE
jgi:hypothetical protein